MILKRKYLCFPVNPNSESRKICLYEDQELIFDCDCAIDYDNPVFTAFVDVSGFIGKNVELKAIPEVELKIDEADELRLERLYFEDYRQKLHFTVKNGWNNDPNGMIYYNGRYHMFYQYNPCSTKWGNMHWGHAVSSDLVHWTEQDIALFPDKTGTMFSGSAIADVNNTSGLGSDALLLYYTAAGSSSLLSKGAPYTQRLAYSIDGGSTFVKYDRAPMLEQLRGGNRDPKVVFVDELGCYVMALYLDGNEYALFRSDDLLHWSELQRIRLDNDAECPDLYPLEFNGERFWIFSGASDRYYVGKFENGGFVPIQDAQRLAQTDELYAAQSFSGTKDRILRIYWDRLNADGARYSQQMSLPYEMSLDRSGDKLFLCAQLAKELLALRKEEFSFDGLEIDENGVIPKLDCTCPTEISLSFDYEDDKIVILSLFGIIFNLSMAENKLRVCGLTMPISYEKKTVELRLIIDLMSVEIIADNGRYIASVRCKSDLKQKKLELSSIEPLKLNKLRVYPLSSIHEEDAQ